MTPTGPFSTGNNGSHATGVPLPLGDSTLPGNGHGSQVIKKAQASLRRRQFIHMAVLEGLRQRSQKAVAIEEPHPATPTAKPRGLDFSPPAGLIPADIRSRLQGDRLPQVTPGMMRKMDWPVSHWRVAWRLMVYVWAAVRWLTGSLMDRLLRRGGRLESDWLERRAIRLRTIIEQVGGTAVKLGQQMAMRIDLIPYEYTTELVKMLDRMKPFPTAQAVQRIEETLGKPLEEVFSDFDPTPIGSASVACVFQAYLKSGERVAIKVRRPGIGSDFAADCKALGAILGVAEFLTILRPGLSRNFLFEFRSMLMEELDFTKEARYAELFRRRVQQRVKWVSAPKVYYELSSDRVMVMEFVSGIWLRELLAAVETKDQEALAALRAQGISPQLIARRLLRSNQFGIFENTFFHADPHPSNVVVQRNSELVFIDFGSCGAYTARERNNWRQLAYYHEQEDIGRMVQAALAILEPLPPIDIDEFSKRLEMVFWQDLYAFKSKHAQWWERTSAKIWIKFLELAREFHIPMNLNTLRMIRSTLLYETIAARLYNRVSAYREHRIYNKSAGKRARRRVRNKIHRWLFRGFKKEEYLAIEELMNMGNRVAYLAQRWLDTPPFRFSLLVNKFVYAVSVSLRGVLTFVFSTLAGGFGVLGYRLLTLGSHGLAHLDIWGACLEVLSYRPYQMLIGVIIFLNIRRVMFRFFDKDIRTDTSGLT